MERKEKKMGKKKNFQLSKQISYTKGINKF